MKNHIKVLYSLLLEKLKNNSSSFFYHKKRKPKIVIFLNNDKSSEIYLNSILKLAKKVDIEIDVVDFNLSKEDIYSIFDKYNNSNLVDGIQIQEPYPYKEFLFYVKNNIKIQKDIEGISFLNRAYLFSKNKEFDFYKVPPTALAVYIFIDYIKNSNLQGLNCTIIGRSDIVGLPVFKLLLDNDCSVSICHSKTKDLSIYTKKADIIVVSVGKPLFFKADLVSKESLIIDVGINYFNNKIVGDVDYKEVIKITKDITPVPGGIGKLTPVVLLNNLFTKGANVFGKKKESKS